MYDLVRARHRELGVLIVVAGLAMLITLRWWTSPILRRVTGRNEISVLAFLLIPAFLLVIGAGIALVLWEPR